MPIDNQKEQLPPEFAEKEVEREEMVKEGFSEAAPQASEPLSASRLDRLQTVLVQAIEKLSDGQLPMQEYPLEGGDVEVVPGEILMMLSAFVEGLEGASEAGVQRAKRYVFDVDQAVTSNQGLEEAIQKISEALADQELAEAMMTGDEAEAPPAEEEMPEEPAEEPEAPEEGKKEKGQYDDLL